MLVESGYEWARIKANKWRSERKKRIRKLKKTYALKLKLVEVPTFCNCLLIGMMREHDRIVSKLGVGLKSGSAATR